MALSINLDTTNVKTSSPVLADNTASKSGYRIRFANVKESEVEGKGSVLALEYHLLDPAPTTDGGQVKPGFTLFDRIYLYGKDTPPGQVPEMSMTKLGKRIDAFLGTGDIDNKKGKPQRPAWNDETVASMIGKEAFVKVKVKSGDFDGNEISSVTYPGDLKP